MDRYYHQPIIQVLPKTPFGNHLGQVAMRGCDDSHIDSNRFHIAYPDNLTALNGAEQLNLQYQRHFADFVQKQRPVMSQLKQSGFPLFFGAGKRTAGIAKQFRFQQRLRQCGTVDLDERAVRPFAFFVNHFGDQFLAGSRISRNDHG